MSHRFELVEVFHLGRVVGSAVDLEPVESFAAGVFVKDERAFRQKVFVPGPVQDAGLELLWWMSEYWVSAKLAQQSLWDESSPQHGGGWSSGTERVSANDSPAPIFETAVSRYQLCDSQRDWSLPRRKDQRTAIVVFDHFWTLLSLGKSVGSNQRSEAEKKRCLMKCGF